MSKTAYLWPVFFMALAVWEYPEATSLFLAFMSGMWASLILAWHCGWREVKP